jgi:predicted transcriptional regulator
MADETLKTMVAEVAAAYFRHSHVTPNEIPSVISTIASSLAAVTTSDVAGVGDGTEQSKPTPVVGIRASVKPDSIACLLCGQRHKTLRRHLNTAHNLEPRAYRELFGLKPDYPLTAPSYSEARSALAKQLGLGQRGPAAKAKGRGGRKAKTPAPTTPTAPTE